MAKSGYIPIELAKMFSFENANILDDTFKKLVRSIDDLDRLTTRRHLAVAFKRGGGVFPLSEEDAAFRKALTESAKLRSIYDGAVIGNSAELDLWSAYVDWGAWSRCPVVYKLHPRFAAELFKSDEALLYKASLDAIPHTTFWLDTSSLPEFRDVKGILVRMRRVFNDDGETYYAFSMGQCHEDGSFLRNEEIIKFVDEKADEALSVNADDIAYTIVNNTGEGCPFDELNVPSVTVFVLQFIAYISEVNKNRDSRVVKRSSAPSPKHLKSSAIEVSEVGYVFGAAFDAKIKEIEESVRRGPNSKSSPHRPHAVRAHWTHVWTGPGRTTLETRWIEPYFTGVPLSASVTITPVVGPEEPSLEDVER